MGEGRMGWIRGEERGRERIQMKEDQSNAL